MNTMSREMIAMAAMKNYDCSTPTKYAYSQGTSERMSIVSFTVSSTSLV